MFEFYRISVGGSNTSLSKTHYTFKLKPKCARGVKPNSSGVKHFLEGVKKHLGGFNPPTPTPENLPMHCC